MATPCAVDGCPNAEPFYGVSWPRCTSCATPVCAAHVYPGSLRDRDEHGVECLCVACGRLDAGLTASATLNGQWGLWHVCEAVLSPTNQNLLNGDLNACLRDMATEILMGRECSVRSTDEKESGK